MSLFNVVNDQAQFDAASNVSSDVHGAGIRFTQAGAARVTTSAGTFFNQGIPMSDSGQVAIVDATAGLPSDTVYLNGLPISANRVCVSRNARSVVSNGLPFDSNGAIAGAINFDLNFIGTDTLDPQVTFTRASTGTFFNSAGVLTSAATNAPRFDYNPSTLVAQGLLIEESRANLVTYSEQFDNAAWTKTNSSITANAATAPSGTVTADKLIEALDVNLVHQTTQSVTVVSLGTYTASCYVKADTRTRVRIGFLVGGTSGVVADANLTAGTITAASAFGGGSAVGSSIQAINNGWYRITVSGTGAAGTSGECRLELLDASGNRQYNGDGTSGLFLWGAQTEAGAFPTSYIPTTTTALTRAEDRASINTMSPWYNASASTIYAEHFRPLPTPAGTFPRAVDFVSTATSDKLGINQLDNRPTVSSQNLYPSGLSWPFTSVAADANNVIKHAIAATVGSGRYAVNGTLGGSDYAIASIPALDQVVIGSGKGFLFNSTLNGWVRRITYYPRRLSNAELQAITA